MTQSPKSTKTHIIFAFLNSFDNFFATITGDDQATKMATHTLFCKYGCEALLDQLSHCNRLPSDSSNYLENTLNTSLRLIEASHANPRLLAGMQSHGYKNAFDDLEQCSKELINELIRTNQLIIESNSQSPSRA